MKATNSAREDYRAAESVEPDGKIPFVLQWSHEIFEQLSFLAIIVTLIVGVAEYHNHNNEQESQAKEHAKSDENARAATAEAAYTEIDKRYADYIKLCMQYPKLDCYSVPHELPSTPDDLTRQRLADTLLVDVFEVAFTRYHNPIYTAAMVEKVKTQWPGWIAYYRKFLKRDHFRAVWSEVHDEYDEDFAKCMNDLLDQPGKEIPATCKS